MSEQTSTPPAASASPVRLEKGASSSPASGAAEPVRLEKQTTTSTTAALPSRPTGAVPPSWQNPPPGLPQHKADKGRQHGRHRVMAWTVAAAAVLVAAAAVVALTVGNPFQKTVVGIASPPEGAFEQESETGAAPELPSVGGSTDTEGTDSAPSTPATPDAANGDLGLSVPISSPACDSTWVVFLGASTDPATYVSDISGLLESQPGAQYTLTQGGCSSMRQHLPDGSWIYAVYVGPFPDQAAACSVRNGIGGLAYVKQMDNVTPADQLWEC